ncbi:MAG: DUF4258 domain-containing protein [Anaerolineales bacterium]
MDILEIQKEVRADNVFFSEHAVRRMAKRDISDDEVVNALLSGEIIEEYPDDKYSPSFLVLGETKGKRPLHVVCSLPPRVRIITVYQPEPNEWMDNRRRKK